MLTMAATAALLCAANAADAPRAPGIQDAGSDDGVAVSPDRRYRVVGTMSPMNAGDSNGSLKSRGYRLEGGIVGVIAEDGSPQREAEPRKARSGDLLEVLSHWGACAASAGCPGDLDGDGFVGPDDLLAAIDSAPR